MKLKSFKKGKYFFLTTTANKHDFLEKQKISKNIYLNINKKDEIRYGKKFFLLKAKKTKKFFCLILKVVTGRVTEIINDNCFDIYMALCVKK